MLSFFPRFLVKRKKPHIIAISGTRGVERATQVVGLVLSRKYETKVCTPAKLVQTILSSKQDTYFVVQAHPQKAGDIDAWFRDVQPEVSVITSLMETDTREFYKFSQMVAEFRKVYEFLGTNDLALINADDEEIEKAAQKTPARTFSYSMQKKSADVFADEVNVVEKPGESGVQCKLMHKGSATPFFVDEVTKKTFKFVLAGIAVGIALGFTPLECAQAVEEG